MGSEVGAERRWGVEKGINGRGGGQIKLVLNCYINNIEQMGNFTGFQKSDDFYIHPRLGQIKRIQKEEGPQLIQHKVLVESEEAVDKWVHEINLLESAACSSILLLPKSHFSQRIGYCGSACDVFLLYDDFMFSLKDEIKNRRAINRPFSESSVWEMLYKIVKAEASLQDFKLKIGNVSPDNILVNQDGEFRVLCQHSWPTTSTLYQFDSKYKLYSPEELQSLKRIIKPHRLHPLEKRNTQSKQPHEEATLSDCEQVNNQEIFSIGVTLLEICSLRDSKQLYSNAEVNQNQVIKRLQELEGKYTRSLIGILWEMLKIDPSERIKAKEIVQMLDPHEQTILNLKPFTLAHGSSNPFCTKTSTTLEKQDITKEKRGEKKWKGFTMFFPFLQNLHQEETLTQSFSLSRDNCPMGKQNFSLTRAH